MVLTSPPVSGHGGMPTPGTPAWFGPGPYGQAPDTREQGARAVFAAATPGLCICLLIGGLIYVIAPVMLLVSFGLSRPGVGFGQAGAHGVRRRTRSLRPARDPRIDDERGRIQRVVALPRDLRAVDLLGTAASPPWRSSVMVWSPTTSIAGHPTPPRGDSESVRTTRPRTLAGGLAGVDPRGPDGTHRTAAGPRSPPPLDLAELAGRSTTTSSISRALDGLNAWQRVVVEALAALPDPTTSAELTALLAGEPDAVTRALDELRARALLWGDDDQLHLVRPVREAQLPYPGGLAPTSPRPLSTARIDAELAACGADDLAVLERLMWSPTGAVRNAARPVSLATARTPVERLLSRQLLRPLDADKVILPREVSWRLRSGRFTPEAGPARAARTDQHRPRRARPPSS